VYIDLSFDHELADSYEVVLTAYRAGQFTPIVSVAGPLAYVFERLFTVQNTL